MSKYKFKGRAPELVYADDLKDNTESVKIKGYRHIAKSYGFHGLMLKRRLILAWMVFKGECDALRYAQDIHDG